MDREGVVLYGKQVFIRFLRQNDVTQEYLSWLNDKEVMKNIATSGYTIESLHAYVQNKINDSNVALFAICDIETKQHIGNVKLDFLDEKAMVSELGILIGDKAFWGKGIANEACKLAMSYGFEKMNLRKIYLSVYESNPAAKKVYEKLGFILEGTLRKHVCIEDQYYDKHLMGIFKEEFI